MLQLFFVFIVGHWIEDAAFFATLKTRGTSTVVAKDKNGNWKYEIAFLARVTKSVSRTLSLCILNPFPLPTNGSQFSI